MSTRPQGDKAAQGRASPQASPPVAAGASLLMAAPHRAMFFAGMLMLLASFFLWGLELIVRAGWLTALPWRYPPAWLHALWAVAGIFPFFIFGFLLTAMPRWQSYGLLRPWNWKGPWCLLASGWLLVYAGSFMPSLMVVGMSLVLLGWGWLVYVFGCIALHPKSDRRHAVSCWLAICAGAVSVLLWWIFFVTNEPIWARMAMETGVWWFLTPVFMTVCHRMLPFFTGNVIPAYTVYRPYWILLVMVLGSITHALLSMAAVSQYLWLCDLVVALMASCLSWRWLSVAVWKTPILVMLHLGFAWLPLAFFLLAGQSLLELSGRSVAGFASLHVLTVGYFGSLLLAMVTRVTLGHSGRPIRADQTLKRLFWSLQLVVLVRFLSDVLPATWGFNLMVLAVGGWFLCFLLWVWRYMPFYFQARVDGKSG